MYFFSLCFFLFLFSLFFFPFYVLSCFLWKILYLSVFFFSFLIFFPSWLRWWFSFPSCLGGVPFLLGLSISSLLVGGPLSSLLVLWALLPLVGGPSPPRCRVPSPCWSGLEGGVSPHPPLPFGLGGLHFPFLIPSFWLGGLRSLLACRLSLLGWWSPPPFPFLVGGSLTAPSSRSSLPPLPPVGRVPLAVCVSPTLLVGGRCPILQAGWPVKNSSKYFFCRFFGQNYKLLFSNNLLEIILVSIKLYWWTLCCDSYRSGVQKTHFVQKVGKYYSLKDSWCHTFIFALRSSNRNNVYVMIHLM